MLDYCLEHGDASRDTTRKALERLRDGRRIRQDDKDGLWYLAEGLQPVAVTAETAEAADSSAGLH